jgi:hypothetical protein
LKKAKNLKNMKKLLCLFLLIAAGKIAAQSDTLYMSDGKKIPCKIYEISEYEMRYRIGGENGTLFVIDKFKVRKYVLANGYSEILLPDELSLEHEHADILRNREVIKFQPFGLAFNHITLAYEKVIKVGMNLDIEAGYVNSDINQTTGSMGMNYQYAHSGAYIKPGMKFFLGKDFSVKGLRYAHPLKGSYVKLELAFSYLEFQAVKGYLPSSVYNHNNYITTNVNTSSYGGFINFGRQMILGNILTLDLYGGVGFTGQSIVYTNKDFKSMMGNQYNNFYYNYGENKVSNYYGWARVPGLGLSFTCGLRLGFIIPAKKPARAKMTQ